MSEEIATTTSEPAPEMSELATLGNIMIEPGRTFEDLRRKPRFILAGLISILLVSIFQITLVEKIGLDKMVRDRIESSSQSSQLSAEQKDKIIEQQAGSVAKVVTYASVPIVMTIVFFVGGLIYFLGINALGGTAKYLSSVSVWVYSSLPPTILFFIANIAVLLIKSADEIEIGRAQQGLIQANPSFFVDGKSQPVLSAILQTFDLFQLIGWVLAAIGLRVVAKTSAGAAWAVVLIVALIGVSVRVVFALLFG